MMMMYCFSGTVECSSQDRILGTHRHPIYKRRFVVLKFSQKRGLEFSHKKGGVGKIVAVVLRKVISLTSIINPF